MQHTKSPHRLHDKVLGCLLAGEIGDAMGAPAENKTYREIIQRFDEITDFSGNGTDDSALKYILCDTIQHAGGYPSADAWAEEWIQQEDLFLKKNLFWVPVMNSFWKIRGETVPPREAGHGTMASSSSAMCISPIGIINAGNPRLAALETFEAASLIHQNFCRDAACAMAAAVAQAFVPGTTVESILAAAVDYLPLRSAAVMRGCIQTVLELAQETGNYPVFRERFYAEHLQPGTAIADSRETVPVALALFYLAGGDPNQTIIYGANFGRDADTIASMAGAIAGAFRGAASLNHHWVEKIQGKDSRQHEYIAAALVTVICKRADDMARVITTIKTNQD